jgi:hypothetical protein
VNGRFSRSASRAGIPGPRSSTSIRAWSPARRAAILDRLSRVPQGIVDEVDDRPADAEPPERPSARIRRAEQGYVSREERIVIDDVAQQRVDVDCFLLFILRRGRNRGTGR